MAEALVSRLNELDGEAGVLFLGLGLALAKRPHLELRTGGHGYIANEIRGYCGDRCHYALVANKNSVTIYITPPELAHRGVEPEQFIAKFPSAQQTSKAEIKYSVTETDAAVDFVDWLERSAL